MPEVVVLGAGPAGAVTALLLARAGIRVVLIDPCHPVAPRAESLLPDGLRIARALGLGAVVKAASLGEVMRMTLRWRVLPETRSFEPPRPVLLSRAHLHGALRSAAVAAGAAVICARGAPEPDGSVVVHGTVRQRLWPRAIVDARGRAAGQLRPLDNRQCALPFTARPRDVGLQPDAQMSLVAHEDGWLWTGQNGNRVFGALVCSPALAHRARQAVLHLPGLTEIVPQRPCDATLRAARTVFDAPTVLRIGDAALARDPIASHGLTHALRSAHHAVAALRTLLDTPDAADAARSFMETRHRQDLEAAIVATRAAHDREGPGPAASTRTRRPEQGTLLNFVASPARVACLDGTHIRWVPGVVLPLRGAPAAQFGDLPAETLREVLQAPGTFPQMADRLSPIIGRQSACALLDHLLAEEALVPAEAARLSAL